MFPVSPRAPYFRNSSCEGLTSQPWDSPEPDAGSAFSPPGINYCALKKPGCEHECVNTEEGYYCRCHRGYNLDPNGKTCSSKCARGGDADGGKRPCQAPGLTSSQRLLEFLGVPWA